MTRPTYIGSGIISDVTLKELNGNLSVCTVTVPVNQWIPGKNGEKGTEVTTWCEMAAFGRDDDRFNQATNWNDKFQKGMAVNFQGIPLPRAYIARDGEPKVAMRLEKAYIEACPETRSESSNGNVIAQEEQVELPF